MVWGVECAGPSDWLGSQLGKGVMGRLRGARGVGVPDRDSPSAGNWLLARWALRGMWYPCRHGDLGSVHLCT